MCRRRGAAPGRRCAALLCTMIGLPLLAPCAPVVAAAASGQSGDGAGIMTEGRQSARTGPFHKCVCQPPLPIRSAAPQAERKIPMNYAGRYRNSALARQSYLPFKVNATGVMPVIFSSTLLSLPTGLSRYVPALEPVAAALGPTGLLYLPARPPARACCELRARRGGRPARHGRVRARAADQRGADRAVQLLLHVPAAGAQGDGRPAQALGRVHSGRAPRARDRRLHHHHAQPDVDPGQRLPGRARGRAAAGGGGHQAAGAGLPRRSSPPPSRNRRGTDCRARGARRSAALRARAS